MPAAVASSNAYWISGLSTTGSISFGMAFVTGRKRVPSPATGNTALRTRFARSLAGAPVRITVVDRRNYHLFQPLLYQVASAALNPSDIASPIRAILNRQKNVEVILGEATSIDVEGKRVVLTDGALAYDY